MARIPEVELERLKRDVAVARLAEARGVKLQRVGSDLKGLCPFHDDHEPSLVISPERNLWHCLGACQAGGSVVDWVMRAEAMSFRHAVEWLRGQAPAAAPLETSPARPAPALRLERAADDDELLRQVLGFYQETLAQSPEALAYLDGRGLGSQEARLFFQLGFANRTLAYQLPESGREGAELRRRLQQLGILRESGHEHFNGSVVVPIFDAAGRVVEIYGRKITRNLRKGTPLHLYLPGPHAGVWNEEALAASKEIILCEALLDALTFWCAGFRHVTAAYGVEGFTADHWETLRRHGTERVLLAYDRDEAGDRAAEALAAKLAAAGIGCYRVQFPRGMDANEYALKVTPAGKSLGLVLRRAAWLGGGSAPAPPGSAPVDEPGTAQASTPELAAGGAAAAADPPAAASARVAAAASAAEAKAKTPGKEKQVRTVLAEGSCEASAPPAAVAGEAARAAVSPFAAAASFAAAVELSPAPPASPLPVLPPEVPAEIKPEEVVLRLGDRRYRVRGLAKNLSYDSLKINLLAGRGEAFHVDTLDLYSARQRGAFTQQAAAELGVEPEAIKRDLGQVLLALERLQDQQIQAALHPARPEVALSAAERAAALGLLQAPDLLERILADFGRCGVVGEETNKLVGYLAAVSRQLDEPLAVIVQSSTAAGKSALMEAVLAFVPEEARVQYSAMTGQSLFYMGATDLKHKVLAIVEEAGAERASYALKLLQSEGELTIASTGKDPATGKLTTHEYRVEGPVAIFLTTTAIEVDEELLNRCLVLTVDEGREQTRAIHRAQREAQTLAGLRRKLERAELLQLHRNAQRLLRPLPVLNPYAPALTFLDSQTRTRRDHMKYLGLINALALLHQHQRPLRRDEGAAGGGQALDYVEVSLGDIAVANRLAAEVLGRTLDELPPQTRKLLLLLDEMVSSACVRLAMARTDYRFSRREVRAHCGWGHTQLKCHLHRLEELEYLLVHRGGRGQSFVYELLYESRGEPDRPFLYGLIDVATLGAGGGYDANRSGPAAEKSGPQARQSGPSRAEVGGVSGGGRNRLRPMPAGISGDFSATTLENAHLEAESKPSSYAPLRRGNGSAAAGGGAS
jgi:DNA primase catalytic core